MTVTKSSRRPMMEPARCQRCDDAPAVSAKFCALCNGISNEIDAGFRAGRRTFWHFTRVDSDEPESFDVVMVDESHIQVSAALRPYHCGVVTLSRNRFSQCGVALPHRAPRA